MVSTECIIFSIIFNELCILGLRLESDKYSILANLEPNDSKIVIK